MQARKGERVEERGEFRYRIINEEKRKLEKRSVERNEVEERANERRKRGREKGSKEMRVLCCHESQDIINEEAP